MQKQIEGALEGSVSSKINSITESVKESLNSEMLPKVQELTESVAKGGRGWIFPFTSLSLFLLAMVGWNWRMNKRIAKNTTFLPGQMSHLD
jgi:hypothetical protein